MIGPDEVSWADEPFLELNSRYVDKAEVLTEAKLAFSNSLNCTVHRYVNFTKSRHKCYVITLIIQKTVMFPPRSKTAICLLQCTY